MKTNSYVLGEWFCSQDEGRAVYDAVSGSHISSVSSEGINFSEVLRFGREVGVPALQAMTLHERASLLKQLALYLTGRKKEFYRISDHTGATAGDHRIDIDGGIGTLFTYSSVARREFGNQRFIVEGTTERLSADNSFSARHILVPRQGVSVHINAFNFPCWGMLEKIAPSLIAGMPVVVKPATDTAYVTEAVVKAIIESEILPEGALQLICGSTGDLLDHLVEQDVVTFTGSAATGQKLCNHPNIVRRRIPFNMEADSLNSCILGQSVSESDPEFGLFIKEVAREMTVKAGQKCTAIRRVLVPVEKVDAVSSALRERLQKIVVGDPKEDGVSMGPLISASQKRDVSDCVKELRKVCDCVFGDEDSFEVVGENANREAFYPPTVLLAKEPMDENSPVHSLEAFGPVVTIMPYSTAEDAVSIVSYGRGSLVSSIVTANQDEVADYVLRMAPYHGRLLVLNRDCAATSTGHGSPLPQLVHGGPGRAGGGEELGGARAVKHYMQRTSVQGSPSMLMAITREYSVGAKTTSTDIHPFKKHFEDLEIGESLLTYRRTVTEADIVNFGCLSGDHFYAHFDEQAATDSLFGKRVAHGYFLISAAAGMFVEPSPGPVLANYGLDNLRFIEPVGIGDTIQARLTVKQKIEKDRRPDDKEATGVVVWDVQIMNQREELCAHYDILTLVVRRDA